MPRITQYDTPELGLRPTETGITATAAAARRVGAEYNEAAAAQRETGRNVAETIGGILGVAQRAIDHQQISTGMVEGEKLIHNLNMSKEARLKSLDPNDPAYGQKAEAVMLQWHEDVATPALENFGKGFITTHGQQWATQFVRSTQRSMFHQTTADISSAASISISNNIKNVASVASNNVFQNPTEENVNETMGRMRDAVTGMVATSPIRGVKGAEFQSKILDDINRKIVQAGATGAIQKAIDPEGAAAEWTAKYPQYIDGAHAKSLAQAAKEQIRAREADARRSELREREMKREASNEATHQYVIEVETRDPKIANDPVAQRILNDQTLLKQDRANLLGLVKRQLKPETETAISNRTFIEFLAELKPGNTVDDTKILQRIWDARLKDPGSPGSLTEAHFEKLRREVAGRKTPEGLALSSDRGNFFKRYGPQIDPTLGTGKLEAQKMDDAVEDAKRLERDLRSKGLDPQLVYDNRSEYFFGKPENLAKYRPTLKERADFDAREKALRNKRETEPTPPSAPAFVPPRDWLWNPARRQYRDPDGALYDASGKPVKR